MRTLSSVVCACGVVACSWLAVMFIVLHHPGFERGAAMSLLFVLQSLLALATINGLLSSLAWRVLTLVGAAGIVWAGVQAVAGALSNPHFEGFAVLIGSALVLQGLLTAGQLIPKCFSSSPKVHQFGN
jgi:hypothetical protein